MVAAFPVAWPLPTSMRMNSLLPCWRATFSPAVVDLSEPARPQYSVEGGPCSRPVRLAEQTWDFRELPTTNITIMKSPLRLQRPKVLTDQDGVT